VHVIRISDRMVIILSGGSALDDKMFVCIHVFAESIVAHNDIAPYGDVYDECRRSSTSNSCNSGE